MQKNRHFSIYRGYEFFLLPGVLFFLIVVIVPFISNIVISFSRWRGAGVLTWIGIDNYLKAFQDMAFWESFSNNLRLIIAMTLVPTFIGLLLAVVLFDIIATHFGQGVASFFRSGFYIPQIIPIVVASIAWKWIYQPDWGVLNQILGLVGLGGFAQNWLGDPNIALASVMVMLTWIQIGYPLVIFMSGLQRIDPELYEAAAIDGASWGQRFVSITLPLLRPELYVVLLTTTIAALKTFGPIYAMTRGGPGNSTNVASYFVYKNFFETANVGYASTTATILTIVVMIVTGISIYVQSRPENGRN